MKLGTVVMTNKTYPSTEQFNVELEPYSTFKAKAIGMQGISHGNNHDGELIVSYNVAMHVKIWKYSCHLCYCIVHNIYI